MRPSPFVSGSCSAPFPWRHLKAPAGVAAPRSRFLFGGEDCLSEASSAALTFGTGAKAPEGPRPGAHGFGSFCRNKRACLERKSKEPRRAGPKPRKPLSSFCQRMTEHVTIPVKLASEQERQLTTARARPHTRS